MLDHAPEASRLSGLEPGGSAELSGVARQRAGHNLHLVQLGLEPGDWRPMTDLGPGVAELRIRTDRAHRVFYVARFTEAIYVLHAFEKKTRKTARQDFEMGRARLREVVRMRQGRRRNE